MGNRFVDRMNGLHSGRKSEKKFAKRIGAKLTPNSGAMKGVKGDVNLGSLMIENKATVTATLSLQYSWLRKVSDEARIVGKHGVLSFQFTNSNGEPKPEGKWVAVPERLFKELVDASGY